MEINQFIELLNSPENEFLDFKAKVYSSNDKSNLLTDIISFANGHYQGSKYLIFGVKEKENEKELLGIDAFLDQSEIEQLVYDNVEPLLNIKLHSIIYLDKKFQVLEIYSEERPYLLKKQYKNLPKGFLKIRRGATNDFISKADLDKMYFTGTFEVSIIDGQLFATKPERGCANLRCRISNFSDRPITIIWGCLEIFEDNELITTHRLYGTSNNIVGADFQLKIAPQDEIIDYFEFGFTSSQCFPLGVDEYGCTEKKLHYKVTFIDANDIEYSAVYENAFLLVKGKFLWKVKLNPK